MKTPARIILAAALVAAPAVAAPSNDLIKQLGSDDWTARQNAEDTLVAEGAAALDDLNAALAGTADVELHERIASAIARIGREQLTGATPVTVDKVFDRPIDALRAIANVAGLSVVTESEKASAVIQSAKSIHLQCQKTPLLEALFNCAADSGVAVRLSGERIVVLDQPAVEGRPRMAVAGAIVLVADSAQRRESIDMGSDRRGAATLLSFNIFTEPKLRLASGSTMLSIKSIVDEQGRTLLKKPAKVVLMHQPDGRWATQIGMVQPDPPATKIATIDVEVLGNVVTDTNELRIDDLASLPVDMQTAAGPVGVRSLTQTNGTWFIVVHVPQNRPNFNGFGSANPRIWQFGDPDLLIINDSHGRRLATGIPTLAMSDDLEMTMPIVLADANDPPKSILIRVPARTRELHAPLTLSNLPLP